MVNVTLSMLNITKVYSNGLLANDNVNLSLNAGEIHGLIGENGAGKTTLMKILYGLEKADKGSVLLNGKEVSINCSSDAIALGIGMVHQHFKLISSLTVFENLVLGNEPRKGLLLDRTKAIRITEELSRQYDLSLDPNAIVEKLSVQEKQKLEILKVLFSGAEILILDEPTAVLTPLETKELFGQLKKLRDNGKTIILISHKLNEIKELCDRFTVMRNGRCIGVYNVADMNESDISRLMVGRDIVKKIDKQKGYPKKEILAVNSISYRNVSGIDLLNDISLTLREGEILAVAGVEGNGQKELVEVLTGFKAVREGQIRIYNKNILGDSMEKLRTLGVAYIPEDRMTFGFAGGISVEENLISNRYKEKKFSGKLFLKKKSMWEYSKAIVAEYEVKCTSTNMDIATLSGGNIQKIVVAREVETVPRLLIAEQPTRGIDIGAAEIVHNTLLKARDAGCGILLISADLNEVLELADSLIVMYRGEIVGYFHDASSLTEEELSYYMLGIKRQNKNAIKRNMRCVEA